MSLESIINEKLKEWAKTNAGKKAIGQSLKSSGVNGNSPTNEVMMKYAQRMRDILREEISEIYSPISHNFLDHIDIENSVLVVTSNGHEYLSVSLSFDETQVMRNSLYPQKYDPVYMPTIINNRWETADKPRARVYGDDGHGRNIASSLGWIYPQDKDFMQRAVNRFNAEMSGKGVLAEYSVNYDGGTYGTKEY